MSNKTEGSVNGKVHVEASTEVTRAESFAGHPAVAVRFNHNSEGTSAAILGLSETQALTLAVQLVSAVSRRQVMAGLKNRMGKTRKSDNPYLVFEGNGWTWKVLKSYQGVNSKPFARFFCAVSSPFTHGSYDLGDTYVNGVVTGGQLTYVDPSLFETDEERAAFMHDLNEARKTDNGGW